MFFQDVPIDTDQMIEWLHVGALLFYGTAAIFMGISFARGARRLAVAAACAVAAGLLLHAAALAVYTKQWHELPLVGLGPSFSTLAFLIGLGTLIASLSGGARSIGLLLIPVVVVFGAVATSVGVVPADQTLQFQGVWFVLHVILAFVGYAGLTVAAAAGLMYLLQFRELKSKHFGAIFRFFPALATLDRLGRGGILVGFPFLTLAVIAGWAWIARFQGPEMPDRSKLTWVVISWVMFIAAILARAGGERRSRRGALASVIGFVVVVLAYLVLRMHSHNGVFL